MGEGKIVSDFPFKVGSEDVIIVQPLLTIGMSREEFLRNFSDDAKRRGEDYFSRIFQETLKFRGLRHISSAHCHCYDSSARLGSPLNYSPCGGEISLKAVVSGKKWMDRSGIFFEANCSNPDCDMRFGIRFPEQRIENIMLHLMLKQMIPLHNSLNFVDFGSWVTDGYFDSHMVGSGKSEEIKKLGLVSVAGDFFWGTIHLFNVPKDALVVFESYSLGFMLMPGMATFRGCGGFDNWLKFLVLKFIECSQATAENSKLSIIGPRQLPNSRLRDW